MLHTIIVKAAAFRPTYTGTKRKGRQQTTNRDALMTYPKNTRFTCIRCAKCCGDTETHRRRILVLTNEAAAISEKTREPIENFANKTRNHSPYTYEMKKTEHGKCVFLTDSTCRIYESRPMICRFYPFRLETDHHGRHVFTGTDECLGTKKGKPMKEDDFRRLLAIAQNRFQSNGEK